MLKPLRRRSLEMESDGSVRLQHRAAEKSMVGMRKLAIFKQCSEFQYMHIYRLTTDILTSRMKS